MDAPAPAAAPSPRSPLPVLLVCFGLAVAFWDTPYLFPVRIFIVFLHEISHGLAAIATGGSIVEIVVVAEEGGHCVTLGGNTFLTLSAGYLGSLLWGVLILTIAVRTKADRALAFVLGVMLIVIALWKVPATSNMFGKGFGIAFGVALAAIALYAPERLVDFLLRFLGLTSCLYAIVDIRSDILQRPEIRSDARMLAEYTHIPTLVWGGLWIVIAVGVTVLLLWKLARKPAA